MTNIKDIETINKLVNDKQEEELLGKARKNEDCKELTINFLFNTLQSVLKNKVYKTNDTTLLIELTNGNNLFIQIDNYKEDSKCQTK